MLRGFLLTLILMAVSAAGFAGYQIYSERSSLTGETTVYLGDNQLSVPRNALYDPDQRQGGARQRLNLVLLWPSMRGAADLPPALSNDGNTLLFLSIEDANARTLNPGDVDPADRPSDIYARFLSEEVWTNPGGLIMRRFRPGTPYADEELYLAEADETTFSARCPSALAKAGPKEEDCLWQTRQKGVELQVRFPARLLPEWETIVENVTSLVQKMRQGVVTRKR